MAEEAPPEPGPAEPEAASPAPDPADRPRDFERYALIAALTLVVLCLLIWDKWDGGAPAGRAPRPDRTLRVEIGGGDPNGPAPPPGAERQVVGDPPAPLRPAPPVPPPERTYTVRNGDNLHDIAIRELGSSSRVREIAELNGLADPSRLKLGQVLKLPAR